MTLSPMVLASLASIDSDWRFIPADNRKRPIDPRSGRPLSCWSSQATDLDGITALATSPHVHAVGVVLGPTSGILAVDFDGPHAAAAFVDAFGVDPSELPKSVAWCSGLPSRYQVALRVPRDYWPHLRGRRVWKTPDDETALELRWVGHQSIVAGAHPDTAGYAWLPGCSPQDRSTATAPDWLLEALLKPASEPTSADYTPTTSDIDRALDLLHHIHPRDDYDSWLRVGMALHSVSPGLLESWVNWSQGCSTFDEAECLAKWSSFKRSGITLGTLAWFANRDGYIPTTTSNATATNTSHHPAAPQQRAPSAHEQISTLVETLIDLQCSTTDTWAEEHEIKAALWGLGVPASAVEERILYALAARWNLPLQTSHNGGRRGRRLSDPIDSPAEDLVPGFLLWQRDHVLFGAGGAGKTMAAAQLAVCCIKGTPFLDQEIPPTRTGRVLWIATDGGEGARAMVREYLEDLGAADDPEVDANLRVWAAEARDGIPSWACTASGLQELRDELETGGYALVVIDSLKAVLELAGINVGIGPVGTLMRLCQALVGRHCSLLWLHHPSGGKSGGKGVAAAAGSQNINQIPSAVHQISRLMTDQGPCNQWDVHKLRGYASREFKYRISDDGFQVVEGTITRNVRDALLDSLELRLSQGIPTATAYLCQEMPMQSEQTIRNNLTWLRKRGLIKKRGSAWDLTPQGRAFLRQSYRETDATKWVSTN